MCKENNSYDKIKEKLDILTKKPASATQKPKKPITHLEDELQMACVEWFKEEAYPQFAPLLFHVNNEPYLGRGLSHDAKERIGARYKSMGVTAGVSDILLLHPEAAPGTAHALCVEFKRSAASVGKGRPPQGKQSKAQVEWQQAVEAVGYRYEVVRTVEAFKTLIMDYLDIAPRDPDQAAVEALFGKDFKAKIHRLAHK